MENVTDKIGLPKLGQSTKQTFLFFDRTSKKNPRKVEVRGIITNYGGDEITSFEWGLGKETNNHAEAYTLILCVIILQ